MEDKQFTTDDLNHSPHSNQGFLADRFTKKSSHLNIPDTIPENSSAELSGESLKMEAHNVVNGNVSDENICSSEKSKCDESLIKRKLEFSNDTISTPPSLLRKEISLLRNEMAEAHEFHDFEIQVLKEEKLNEIDSQNYLELFEKYSSLMELYTTLKAEYDEYRKEQEKMRQEVHSKTADYLESICSQIEASDNSFNFSNASFASFNGGIKSSTMMEDVSEVEATVVHDATILANDPLSLSTDGVFKTPMQTPLKSTKKLFREELNSTVGKPIIKEVEEIMSKRETTIPIDSEYNIQLLNLETALYDKVKEVEDLEQRLFRVEDLSSVLKSEFERITSIYAKENIALKESLSKKTEQLNEVSQKLFTETISLNPSLRDSLTDVSGIKLLVVFIETIMESCNKIQNDKTSKHNAEKASWEEKRKADLTTIENLQNQVSLHQTELNDLKKMCETLEGKLSDAENTILFRNEEIRRLQARVSTVEQIEEDFASAREAVSELESRLTLTEAEKAAAENRYRELETTVENLKQEIGESKEFRLELQTQLLSVEEKKSEIENENACLKQSYDALKNQITEVENKLKNELSIQFDSQRLEWEAERKVDLNLITNLQDQIKNFTEKIIQNEAQIMEMNVEKENLLKLQENYKNQILEAEKNISTYNVMLMQMKDDLAEANETIAKLKSQLESVLSKDVEVKERYRKLEETLVSLQNEVELKEGIIKNFNELKIIWEKSENENGDLKRQIVKLEEVIIESKNSLEKSEKERSAGEVKIKDLQNEINLLKKEQKDLLTLSEKLETLEKNNKNLVDILSDVQFHLDMSENTLEDLISNNFENKKIFSERISSLIKIPTENQISWQETKGAELEELKKVCENLKKELSDAEKMISAREAEISIAQSDVQKAQEDFNGVVKRVSDLEFQLAQSELEKKEIESRALNSIKELKQEIELKDNLQEELNTQKKELEAENIELKRSYDTLKSQVVENEKDFFMRDEEIRALKSGQLEMTAIKENLTLANETILHLKSQLNSVETEKKEIESRALNSIRELKQELDLKDNLQEELNTQKKELEAENIELKRSYDTLKSQVVESEKDIFTRDEEIRALKSSQLEMTAIKENLTLANETILHLKSQLNSVEIEKNEIENLCRELQERNQNLLVEITSAKNLENNPAYGKIQNENDDLKQRILESENVMSELKNELKLAKENQISNICKVEELIQEIEELKKENTGFSHVFITIEEAQKNLADLLSDDGNDGELPSDRISKFICQNPNLANSVDTRETKIISDFVETISKTCKGVQNELIKKFDNKKLEWESQKDVDIKNLQDQIELLTERNMQHETLIKQKKDDLAAADEAIIQLKSQLSLVQTEKVEIEIQCRKLKNDTLSLQAELDTKEIIIKGLDELKVVREKIENENSDLKQQILKSEDVITRLKKCLEITKEEQIAKELKMQDLQNEINLLKSEQEEMTALTNKVEGLEKSNRNLLDVLLDIQSHLNMPEDILTKLLSGSIENKKIFCEKINNFAKTQMEGLKAENKNLKFGIDNMKENIKQLTKLIGETASNEQKEYISNLNNSHPDSISLRSKSNKSIDICTRRLEKLEKMNHNLTELLTRILTMTDFLDLDKLKLCSVRDFPDITEKVVAHFSNLDSKMKELKEENAQLDEECETYANIIKDLKKEAAAVWKTNKEKTEAMEAEINRLKEQEKCLEKEKEGLLTKISKLESECEKLKTASKIEGPIHSCTCGNESKKINELKRIILLKEQKLLELQDLESQSVSYKSQIEYLKIALEREKKKSAEEKEKNKKLQSELNGTTKNQKTDNKADENQILDELRMRGSISGGIVQEFVDKEKMRKLSKDIGILKELCRARYTEIKRLEAVNASLRNGTPKNSNQMDSPIRTRGYSARAKNQVRDFWRGEVNGKENGAL